MKSLIQIQQDASDAILALPENGPRAAGYGLTFLNRRTRSLAALRKGYVKTAMALGFSEVQALEQWGDIKDYTSLSANG